MPKKEPLLSASASDAEVTITRLDLDRLLNYNGQWTTYTLPGDLSVSIEIPSSWSLQTIQIDAGRTIFFTAPREETEYPSQSIQVTVHSNPLQKMPEEWLRVAQSD